MTKFAALTVAIATAASVGLTPIMASAETLSVAPAALTEEEVTELREAWGRGIVDIGTVHAEGGDYSGAAAAHISKFYAYEEADVLFKPTLASEDQFRGTFDEALSYFVGGSIVEDGGFAIAPYSDVRWENEGTFISGDTAMAMGNYYFTQSDGSEVKVEYTFGIERMESGDPKIVLHHSSVPYAVN